MTSSRVTSSRLISSRVTSIWALRFGGRLAPSTSLFVRSQAAHDVVGLDAVEEPVPVNILPTRRNTADSQHTGQTLGRGMDFALVVLVFLGIGYALDRWLDTKPLFMISLVLFSVIGQFVKMYYDYSATMNDLEAQRAEQRQAQRV